MEPPQFQHREQTNEHELQRRLLPSGKSDTEHWNEPRPLNSRLQTGVLIRCSSRRVVPGMRQSNVPLWRNDELLQLSNEQYQLSNDWLIFCNASKAKVLKLSLI